ncbi:MAG TPA: hypothetical protein VNO86_03860 [Candidatus Binatia bacterium]|nr:hypothetical protein [Candidatus Binatia bacterium]
MHSPQITAPSEPAPFEQNEPAPVSPEGSKTPASQPARALSRIDGGVSFFVG